ncbi:MAG: DUF4177 domain-containing protein [Candidatus Methanoperedens sp.]|nr:DUF4177 domain-containing protein [Candidatus Methanoperedens sp.]
MKKYKVVCLTSGATVPPEPDAIEKEIEAMTEQGWDFVQFTSGGGGSGNGNITSWVYLLFKREF